MEKFYADLPNSLAKTFDSVEEAFFFKEKFSASLREQVADWIAEHQGSLDLTPNVCSNAFRYQNGIRLFTGEVLRSGASLRHVTGEEACGLYYC